LDLTAGGAGYRPGPDAILDELPAGGIERDETPEQAALRELREETGYAAGDLLDCVLAGPPKLDPSEFIEVVEKPLSDFVTQLRSGVCTDPEVGWMGLFHIGYLRVAGCDIE
jgi:ADP-ribose pyrophosphatase